MSGSETLQHNRFFGIQGRLKMAAYVQGASQLPQWIGYVSSLPWIKGSLDDSSNRAFLRAASFQIDPQTAADEIARRIIDTGGRLRLGKLVSQCQSAYSYAAVGSSGVLKPSAGIQVAFGRLGRS